MSVCLLAYRSAATIEAAVRSALEQTHPVLEILVREQGGDPGERRLLDGLAAGDPRVVVTGGPNLGFAGGHDELLRTARGEVVVLLNADAALAPTCVAHAVAVLAADQRCAAVQPKVLRPGSDTIDAAGLEVDRARRAVARGRGERDGPAYDEPGEVFGVDGAVAILRRVALDDAAVAVPGAGPPGERLPRSFGSYHEDVDLAWRLRWRGWTARYEPAALAWHARSARDDERGALRVARSRRDLPVTARQQGWANQRLVLVRVEPLRGVGVDLVAIVARELASWLLLLTRPGDLLPSLAHLVRGLPAAVRARRVILARRVPGADPRLALTGRERGRRRRSRRHRPTT